MKNKLILIVTILGSINFGFAQKIFEVKNGSAKYNGIITVDSCSNENCEGEGVVILKLKKTNQIIQTFTSKNLEFYLDEKQKPTVNVIQLYDEQSPLIFDDFNFDGTEDLAIRNGNNSGYGGLSYDVYIFNSTQNKFVLSDELTNLVLENLGMFQVDTKRKRIITFTKSGAAWHSTAEYEVVPKKGLQKVFELEEDASGGEFVTVTTRKLINHKWKSSVKKYKASEYYKD